MIENLKFKKADLTFNAINLENNNKFNLKVKEVAESVIIMEFNDKKVYDDLSEKAFDLQMASAAIIAVYPWHHV